MTWRSALRFDGRRTFPDFLVVVQLCDLRLATANRNCARESVKNDWIRFSGSMAKCQLALDRWLGLQLNSLSPTVLCYRDRFSG